MTNQPSLTEYFHQLAHLMQTIEATDREGRIISAEAAAERALEMFFNVRKNSGKVMLIGNGGSSAIASHAQNDLAESARVKAMVFTGSPELTARANDHGYETVYERPIQLWADDNDLLFAITSSGQSKNILRAINAAHANKCKVVTLTGFKSDNPARLAGDVNFFVNSEVYGYVESAHTALTHYLTTSIPRLTGD